VTTSIEYQTVDVFTDERFGGNQLAVVSDARGLDAGQMQRIASEFNYSESAFVLPPTDPGNTARVRLFTPGGEVPFAGHPNVGTAFVLGRNAKTFGPRTDDLMRFEEGAGLIEVRLLRDRGEVVGASIKAPRSLSIGPDVASADYAACLSLPVEDIVTARHAPVAASVGLPFALAEVRSADVLGRIRVNAAVFHDMKDRYRLPELRFATFVYAWTGPKRVQARMFAPLSRILEDPATGSASAALGGLLCSLDSARDADTDLVVRQGVEIGRPSTIEVAARKRNGVVESVTISGRCVPVMCGTLTL
jgi:trans-2,3-dihydro-3-hydroxyanthranilate isomerase